MSGSTLSEEHRRYWLGWVEKWQDLGKRITHAEGVGCGSGPDGVAWTRSGLPNRQRREAVKRELLIVSLICLNLSPATAVATSVVLTLESSPPATFPTVSTTIDIPDVDDQVEVSRQAALFALSPSGWDLENTGQGGWLQYREPAQWTGHLYFLDIPVALPVASEIEDLFGYQLTEFGGVNGPSYLLFFHTDEWVGRREHEIGESLNNYGVISGGQAGESWYKTPVPNWGAFSVQLVPEPEAVPTLSTWGAVVLALSLAGLGAWRVAHPLEARRTT